MPAVTRVSFRSIVSFSESMKRARTSDSGVARANSSATVQLLLELDRSSYSHSDVCQIVGRDAQGNVLAEQIPDLARGRLLQVGRNVH